MLKLERKSRDGQVKVLVRDREYPINRTLAIAFAAALGFHLLFFILFQISPFRIAGINTLFPPVHVEADVVTKEIVSIAMLEQFPLSIPGIAFPTASHPAKQERPEYLAVRPSVYIKETHHSNNAFSALESEIYQPEIALPKRTSKRPVELFISGLLAEKKLVSPPIDAIKLPTLPNRADAHLHVVYDLVVEGSSGRVIWFEPKHQTNIPALDVLAGNIVENLEFAPDPRTFTTTGSVELHYFLEAQ